MNASRRRFAAALVGGPLLLSACVGEPPLRVTEAGTACFLTGRDRYPRRGRSLCTRAPVPGAEAEHAAKAFAADPERLVIYVVRDDWGDADNLITVKLDGALEVETPPRSFLRLRAQPGSHRLLAAWRGGTTVLDLSGAAGEVLYVALHGSVWIWGSRYTLEPADAATARKHASKLRLVADLDWTRRAGG